MEQISILIVEDHKLIRDTWVYVINSDSRFKVIAQTDNGEEAEEIVKAIRPAIVIMDITLPGRDGIETTEKICNDMPGIKIIGMSAHSKPEYARQMLEKGASGFVTKNSSREEMFTAIIEVHNGNKYICSEIRVVMDK